MTGTIRREVLETNDSNNSVHIMYQRPEQGIQTPIGW